MEQNVIFMNWISSHNKIHHNVSSVISENYKTLMIKMGKSYRKLVNMVGYH
jgi:hypothetical protein